MISIVSIKRITKDIVTLNTNAVRECSEASARGSEEIRVLPRKYQLTEKLQKLVAVHVFTVRPRDPMGDGKDSPVVRSYR